MKKLFLVMAAVATMLAGCAPEENPENDNQNGEQDEKPVETPSNPVISFAASEPSVEGDVATFTVDVKGYTGKEALTIPVAVETEAVEGTDFEISAKEFVWGGDAPVTTITVTQLSYLPEKPVKLTLEMPEGCEAGEIVSSETKLLKRIAFVSFEEYYVETASNYLELLVTVSDMNGEFSVPEDVEFYVAVDEEKSTAVLGEHFEFDYGENFALVYEGDSEGYLFLNLLKIEEGKDKIVLKLEDAGKYGFGNNMEIEIKLLSYFPKLAGKWSVHEIISTPEFLEEMGWWTTMNGWDVSVYNDVPSLNANDSFEVIINDGSNGRLIPNFESTFKNYFIGETNISNAGGYEVFLDGMSFPPVTASTTLVVCDNINRYFHASEMSEDKEGYVAFGFTYDETLDEDILTMYVIDHTSHSFLPGVVDIPYDWGGYSPDKPSASTPGQWIAASFRKVTE